MPVTIDKNLGARHAAERLRRAMEAQKMKGYVKLKILQASKCYITQDKLLTFEPGQEVMLPADQAQQFINEGWAETAKAKPKPKAARAKSKGAAPENKAKGKAK